MNPALLSYVKVGPLRQLGKRAGRRRERGISKRLQAETIEQLVAEYVSGATAAELGRRYGLSKSSVTRLVRQAGELVRHPRFSSAEKARLVALYEAGLTQKDIGEQLGRSPSAVWHCLRRLGLQERRGQ